MRMLQIAALSGLMTGLCEAAEAAVAGGAPPSTGSKKPESETVKLSDGRTVEFVGKRRLLKESLFPEGQLPQVRLDFRNGETRLFQIPQELLYRFAAHGAEQKLGDETAGEEDIDDMVMAVDAIIERLSKRNADGGFAGEWSTVRQGGMSGTSVLMKALMEFSSKSKEEVMAFLKDKTPADKIALRNSAKLKPIVERLESEKLAKASKVDTDALLAGLGGAPAAA